MCRHGQASGKKVSHTSVHWEADDGEVKGGVDDEGQGGMIRSNSIIQNILFQPGLDLTDTRVQTRPPRINNGVQIGAGVIFKMRSTFGSQSIKKKKCS